MTSNFSTNSTSRSRGRPRHKSTELLQPFRARNGGRVREEVLRTCVVRGMFRVIWREINDEDNSKGVEIKPYIQGALELIELNMEEIQGELITWFGSLSRDAKQRNRQYNKREIIDLFSRSPRISEIFEAYIYGIVRCPSNQIKSKLLNLKQWPEHGDAKFIKVMKLYLEGS